MAASLKHRVRSFATAAVRYRLAAAPAAIAALLLSASTVFALDPKLEFPCRTIAKSIRCRTQPTSLSMIAAPSRRPQP